MGSAIGDPDPGHRRWFRLVRPRSLVGRLTLWYACSAFVLVACAAALLYWALVANLDRKDDEFLADTIQIVRALLRERPFDVAALRQEVEWEGVARRYARVLVRVLDERHRIVLETAGTSEALGARGPAPSDRDPVTGSDVVAGGVRYRTMAAMAVVGDGSGHRRVVQVALDRTGEAQLLARYRWWLWLVLAFAALGGAAGGHVIARRGMQPVEAIAHTAASIRTSTLHERIEAARFPSELAALAETFNQMLDRLGDAFARLSRFSSDIAHELRTPINNLRGEMEVALARARSGAGYRDVLESCLEECVRLSQIIDGLMFLAKAESASVVVQRATIDVGREVQALCELYEPAAGEGGVRLGGDVAEPLMARLDRALFQRALSNLIANAITHTPPGGRVDVRAVRAKGNLCVEVVDTGSGIPPEHLPHVCDRFYRVDPARSTRPGGLGLGLAIVKSIAEFHGGSIAVARRHPQPGTIVTLTFPDQSPELAPSGHAAA